MKVFIAGVMQGSREDHDVHAQDYRQLITEHVLSKHPDSEVIDPWAIFPGAIHYDAQQAKETLFKEMELAATSDVLIAYLPMASMGTTLEMWSAYQNDTPIVCISPMARNWVVQSLAAHIHPTLEDFLTFVDQDGLAELLNGHK